MSNTQMSESSNLDNYQRFVKMALDCIEEIYKHELENDTNQEVSEHDNDPSPIDSLHQTLENPESFCIGISQTSRSQSNSSATDETLKTEVTDVMFYDSTNVPTELSTPLLRSAQRGSEASDIGTHNVYLPNDDITKAIHVGSEYQAMIPECLPKYDDVLSENKDNLLWDPSKLTDEEVEDFLRQSKFTKAGKSKMNSIDTGSHVRDDEEALFILLQSAHNKEEALRRWHEYTSLRVDSTSSWSEDECRRFEAGLSTYGKDFHSIQMNNVKTRTVGELVQFYYLWKKTERHDVFVTKNRIEKKKYALHPGSTDYMDWFIDDEENSSSVRVN